MKSSGISEYGVERCRSRAVGTATRSHFISFKIESQKTGSHIDRFGAPEKQIIFGSGSAAPGQKFSDHLRSAGNHNLEELTNFLIKFNNFRNITIICEIPGMNEDIAIGNHVKHFTQLFMCIRDTNESDFILINWSINPAKN